MVDQSRLEDLRRRVQRDPASIAFAQLAEEYRRAGQYAEAIEACRTGLVLHPGYLSARVTLGRALIELERLDEAQQELAAVLTSAPENLAAVRGLAEVHHKRGEFQEALAYYKTALGLARNDPDLEEMVSDLERRLAPSLTSAVSPPPASQVEAPVDTVPAEQAHAAHTRAALEEWLAAIAAINVARTGHRA